MIDIDLSKVTAQYCDVKIHPLVGDTMSSRNKYPETLKINFDVTDTLLTAYSGRVFLEMLRSLIASPSKNNGIPVPISDVE